MMQSTHTYAVLDVAPRTFADICTRLERAGALGDYLMKGDTEHERLIVFGTVALRSLEESPGIGLREVPVYDAPELAPSTRSVLKASPWERIEGGALTLDYEIGGILVGFALVANARGQVDQITMQQAMAEIKNLILMCGGKVKDGGNVNVQEGK